jgi:hypothetical protein
MARIARSPLKKNGCLGTLRVIVGSALEKSNFPLAVGNTATEAVQRFRVTGARISQVRSELQASWEEFQGETP